MSKVVARPVPKAQTDDPRTFQIGQIQRRYKPKVSEHDGSTVLAFSLKPSDPDFPYEIDELECILTVAPLYPAPGNATLRVKNKDIPRGFQINIERGFDAIAANAPNATLLSLINRLDNQLESILSGQMAETIKIVPNKAPAKTNEPKSDPPAEELPIQTKDTPTREHLDEAQAKRRSDVRQLEARFGRLQLYEKSSDGLTYTLPLDSPKRSTWPTKLQVLRSIRLTVPELYPLEPPLLTLDSESEEARNIENAFSRHAAQEHHSTLTQQVNYLSQNLKDMAVSRQESKDLEPEPNQMSESTDAERSHQPASQPSSQPDRDKSHIQYIPRPPEWDAAKASESDDDSATDESFDDISDEDEAEANVEAPQDNYPSPANAPAERGVLLSFPHLELHGIELLELISLNITVKCERCKDTMDIERLRNSATNSKAREVSCKKCASILAVAFRADLIHANSVRGGYLDLDGCTVIDMLPR